MLSPMLTGRQLQVLRLVKKGRTLDEIAIELGLSTYTVKDHCDALRRKFGVAHKRDLIEAGRYFK